MGVDEAVDRRNGAASPRIELASAGAVDGADAGYGFIALHAAGRRCKATGARRREITTLHREVEDAFRRISRL